MTFISFSVSLWNDLAGPVFDGVGLAGFKSNPNDFFIGLSYPIPFSILLIFPFSSFFLFGLIRCKSFFHRLALQTSFNNNKNNIFEPFSPHPAVITFPGLLVMQIKFQHIYLLTASSHSHSHGCDVRILKDNFMRSTSQDLINNNKRIPPYNCWSLYFYRQVG